MNFGFIQNNSRKLSVEEQKAEIESFCNREHIALDRWEDNPDSLLNQVKAFDLVICIELYFLSDSIYTVMEILSHCMDIGCKVWSIRDGHRLGDSETSKDMALAFDLYAEVRRKFASTQTKKALSRRKEEGITLGKPAGSHNRSHKLDKDRALIRRMLSKGKSKAEICRRVGCVASTLDKWLKLNNLEPAKRKGHSKPFPSNT